ncbi:ProQ/FINO family protein [Halovibrio sp. HP20-50]|uniref:ProQ/FINO family protein n=1 Tax=Halovibrio sp. HP20-59 TaxID=3080275 RepID=UPI00294B49CC|nr:ProQ/FINO family protein [Halovibrio sp. HP20-59]MEA2120412.1 ProQ/FINO family protein [Halovibrio sp. HP20-59]
MAASLTNMLDDLEARLERTQAELQVLREENQQLKQRLAADEALDTPLESAQADDAGNDNADNVDAVLAQSEETEPPRTPEQPATPEPSKEPEQSVAPEQPNEPEQPAQTPSPHALLNQWYERYPNAFFKGHTKPLKVGIHQDLAEREAWPNKLIRRALANYVNLPRYIKAVRVGVERVDLDGQPAGKVDKEAALHAAQKRGDKQAPEQPKERSPKPKADAQKPRQEAPKQPDSERKSEKGEAHKPLSMEDKLLGLQQKFKGR